MRRGGIFRRSRLAIRRPMRMRLCRFEQRNCPQFPQLSQVFPPVGRQLGGDTGGCPSSPVPQLYIVGSTGGRRINDLREFRFFPSCSPS
jgi:hypothetical protein